MTARSYTRCRVELIDKLTSYREIVERIVRKRSAYKASYGQIETIAVIDREADHYVELDVGWKKECRIHGGVIHLDIIDSKIWVQCDNTNRPVADELLAAGVPKEDIVLAFHPAELWQHTGFGVAPSVATASSGG